MIARETAEENSRTPVSSSTSSRERRAGSATC